MEYHVSCVTQLTHIYVYVVCIAPMYLNLHFTDVHFN